VRAIRRFTVRTVLPGPIAPLAELAANLRWSWHPPTRDLFASISPERWESSRRDPIALLGAFSPEELDAFADDAQFVARVESAAADLSAYLTEPRWYQTLGPTVGAPPAAIAYFSPEFGITAVLPQYSGGLGILAGDHLKSASDLGVPIIGVGLLYQFGYFKQSLTRDGWQHEDYPVMDPNELPIAVLREADGTPATVSVELSGGRVLTAHVWKAQVGRVPLLMLDSNFEGNDEATRAVTDRLYGGTSEHRLHQEMLLGIGGVRALRLWSRLTGAPTPEVYHTNEGHAGFLGLERIRELAAQGLPFEDALEVVRAATVFTTHTRVPAGIDRFGRDLIMSHFGPDTGLGLPLDQVLALGAESYPGGDPSVFNMAVMGLRLAQRANGVSQLHGVVSRSMFEGLWPGFDGPEVPITSITNGVHAPTWVDHRVIELAEKHIGPRITVEARAWEEIDRVPADELWAVRRQLRSDLVDEARRRVRASWIKRGASRAELGWVDEVLDPDVLTIGFARRVPTYKRLTLMLRDGERLTSLLLHPTRPIQLVIAGKSHPADETGKRLIQQLVQFSDNPAVRQRIVFLPNYDIAMAQALYPGCDVWLNNPLRPFEACGTSGMKSALNGGLNLSILDGWWDEWYDGENGWAIPTADGVEDPERRDDLEAAALYELMENSVVPRFYDRDDAGLPRRWLSMVRHTFSSLGPKVLASRMVADYVRQLYIPAAAAGRSTTPELARELSMFKARVRAAWPGVRVDHVDSSGVSDSPQVGDELQVRAMVLIDGLTPDDVEVQVVHGRVSPADTITDSVVQTLDYVPEPVAAFALAGGPGASSAPGSAGAPGGSGGTEGRYVFEGTLKLRRTGPFGYTVRVLPKHRGLVSSELGLVANA
jgi:starch phosphorylase